jgi:hypothetical protein
MEFIDRLAGFVDNLISDVRGLKRDLSVAVRNLQGQIDTVRGDLREIPDIIEYRISARLEDYTDKIEDRYISPIYEYIFDKVGDLREDIFDIVDKLGLEITETTETISNLFNLVRGIDDKIEEFKLNLASMVSDRLEEILERFLDKEL